MSGFIRVGIIGLSAQGGFASRAHVPALSSLSDYELTGLTARTPQSSAAAASLYQVRAYDTPEQLASSDDVDLVVVAVRLPFHDELVRAALLAGKSVLCEWPLGRHAAEGAELAAEAEVAGVRTAIGLQARSAPVVRYLADLIAEGYLGRPLSTTVSAHVCMWGANVPSAQQRYLITPDAGGSLLTIPFGHAIDAVSFVLGELRNIKATLATQRPVVYDVDSGADLQMMVADQLAVSALLGDSGVVASIHYRGGAQLSTPFRWEIWGTEGRIIVEANSGNLQLATAVSILGARGEGALVPLEVPAAYRLDPALEALKGTGVMPQSRRFSMPQVNRGPAGAHRAGQIGRPEGFLHAPLRRRQTPAGTRAASIVPQPSAPAPQLQRVEADRR